MGDPPRRHPRSRRLLAISAVALAASTAWVWSGPRAAARSVASDGPDAVGQVVINEVQYDPPQSQNEAAYEWVELFNPGTAEASLAGWRLADAQAEDKLPELTLAPGEFLIVAGGAGFAEAHPGFGGRLVVLDGTLGSGLGNGGDQVKLLAADGRLVDGLSYGNDRGVLDPPAPDVGGGHSLERVPAGTDMDVAADWSDQPVPTPGQPAGASPTGVPPTPAAQPTPSGGVPAVLNEYLPAPSDVDWDGDGRADGNDEWVEVFNPSGDDLILTGWQLDDVVDGGSDPFLFPDGTVLGPRGYLLVFRKTSNVTLNNTSDSVRLVRPDGSVADATAYARTVPDGAYARQVDGSGPWTDTLPPSPGRANGGAPGPSQATPAATPAATLAVTPATTAQPTSAATVASTRTATSGGPLPTVTSTATPGPSPTGRPSPDPLILPLLISELLFDSTMPGNDAAQEWVELFNRSAQPVSLAGLALGDGSAWDALPEARIPGRGYLVVAGSKAAADALTTAGIPAIAVADGRIGGGLANGGDVVRLRGPTGAVLDAVSYGSNLSAFDPAVPIGAPGNSLERLPSERDTDSAADWWVQRAPSPGRQGEQLAGPPQVFLNEVLPDPRRRDWDGDGAGGFTDEWVELFNASRFQVDLGDWKLAVGPDASHPRWSHTFPKGEELAPRTWRVVHRAVSTLALGNTADVLWLVRPDGVVADRFEWTHSPGADRSWSRSEDGGGAWTDGFRITPGAANQREDGGESGDALVAPDTQSGPPQLPPESPRLTIAAVRALPLPGRRQPEVRIAGQVTVPPGAFGWRTLYVADATGGIRLYLATPSGRLPTLRTGEWVAASGRVRSFHGELEVQLANAAAVQPIGVPVETAPDLTVPVTSTRGISITGAPAGLPTGPSAGGAAGRTDGSARRTIGVPLPSLVLPVPVRTGALGESVEGRLVRLRGRVVSWRGNRVVLDDGSGPAAVVWLAETRTRRPFVRRGEWLTVSGVASQWAERAPWQGGYRLLPPSAADLIRGSLGVGGR